MGPDNLPEKYLEVNGFRRVDGNSSYVEWRRTDGRRVARVWAEFGARGPPVIDVLYEVRRGKNIVDQGSIAEVGRKPSSGGKMWREAVERAAMWMQPYNGSGGSSGVPEDLNFG